MKQNNQDVVISCTRCTSSVPIGQTTYDINGKNLICFNCYNKIVRGAKPDRLVQSAEMPERLNYTCLACGFKFSRAVAFQFGGHCFNCGKPSVQREETKQIVMRDRKSLLDY